MSENFSRVKKVLGAVFSVSPEAIQLESSPDTIKAWDSLNHLKLVLALESEFDISFSEEQTVEIMSVELIKAVLSEHGIQF